jgi:peptide deformylase
MAKLKVQTGPDNPMLRQRSEEVTDLVAKTPELNMKLGDLVKAMKKAVADEKGLGLAAPQVGENVRLILVRVGADSDKEVLFAMINPEILEMSASEHDLNSVTAEMVEAGEVPFGVEVGEEGCLSLPGSYVNVARASEMVVRFRDGSSLIKGRGGKRVEDLSEIVLDLKGLNARVVQHEVDHLNGVLICDKGV